MNTKLFKLLTAGAIVLLSACGDTVIDNDDSNPVQTKATLNVRVKDAVTDNPLDASVTLNTTGESKVTSAVTGTFSFKSVSIGNHSVRVEKAGYATAIIDAGIGSETTSTISVAQDNTVEARLYPLTSSLTGFVFYDTAGVSKPAPGAPVRLTIRQETNIADRVFNTVTGADGSFIFSDLPAVRNSYNLEILEWGAYKTTSVSGSPSLVSGTAANISTVVKYGIDDLKALFDLLTYNSTIQSTDTLKVEFSGGIDAAKLALKPDMAVAYDGGYNVIPTVKIASGKTLKLKPLGATGKWPGNFNVVFNQLASVDGKELSEILPVTVIDKSAKFELLKYNESPIKDTDIITLEFSLAIDTLEYRPSQINLGTAVATKIVEGNKIKLVPANRWLNDITVRFNGLKAVNGQSLTVPSNGEITIQLERVDLTLEPVGKPALNQDANTIDYNTTSGSLKFKNVEGALGYEVYYRGSAAVGVIKDAFYKSTSPCGSNNLGADSTTCSFALPNDKFFANGDSVVFLVRAINNTSETKLTAADSLIVKDKKSPLLSAIGPTLVYNWYYNPTDWSNALAGTGATASFSRGCIQLPEPMNTATATATFVDNAVPAAVEAAVVNTRVVPTIKWKKENNVDGESGDTYLCLDISTAAGTAITNTVDVKLRISGLQDKAGNPFELSSGATKINTLDIRIQVN